MHYYALNKIIQILAKTYWFIVIGSCDRFKETVSIAKYKYLLVGCRAVLDIYILLIGIVLEIIVEGPLLLRIHKSQHKTNRICV